MKVAVPSLRSAIPVAWREFAAEAADIIAEADPPRASGYDQGVARSARPRGAERDRVKQAVQRLDALERWSALTSAIHWVSDLEEQLWRDTRRTHQCPSEV